MQQFPDIRDNRNIMLKFPDIRDNISIFTPDYYRRHKMTRCENLKIVYRPMVSKTIKKVHLIHFGEFKQLYDLYVKIEDISYVWEKVIKCLRM